jgi:tRNA (cytidine/uridine-2'-O-)-methyltransferase
MSAGAWPECRPECGLGWPVAGAVWVPAGITGWEDGAMLHVAFVEPRIPANSGNAIRMVAATGAHLHLIDPLFDLSDAKLRRAGLDYHDLATVTVHVSMAQAWPVLAEHRIFAFATRATRSFADVSYADGDVLMFGAEPTGLPEEILADSRITELVRIPMLAGRRSLNLSNAAAVAVYEAWRQLGFAPLE